MIDSSEEPPWLQVARLLEHRIHTQTHGYGPGWVLPPAGKLARELGLGDVTVARAYRLLAHLGLVTLRPGYGATVRQQRDRTIIHLPAGTTVTARMPTLAEQDSWQLDAGVPMLIADGQAWPADRYELVAGDSEPPPADQG